MTIAIANTANTNTFFFWQTQTNQLAAAMSTATITTTANGTTAQTAGNAAIGGTFTANIINLVTSSYVGNSSVNTSANATSLSISNSTVVFTIVSPTTTQVSNGSFYLNANGLYTYINPYNPITNSAVTTSGTTLQNVDSFSITTYRSAEYLVNVFDNVANNHYSSKIHITHDTASAYITEYGHITTNSAVGVFYANVISGNVFLQFTPISTGVTVRFNRIII